MRDKFKKCIDLRKMRNYNDIKNNAQRAKKGGCGLNKKLIAQKIKELRLSKGITATFMAKQLGFKAVSSYSRIEKGETVVTLEQAKTIADLLMVDVNDFFTQKLRDTHNNTNSA